MFTLKRLCSFLLNTHFHNQTVFYCLITLSMWISDFIANVEEEEAINRDPNNIWNVLKYSAQFGNWGENNQSGL